MINKVFYRIQCFLFIFKRNYFFYLKYISINYNIELILEFCYHFGNMFNLVTIKK